MADAARLPLERLEEQLRAEMGSSVKNLTATELAGGASNPTYLLESEAGRCVLRSKPLGHLVSTAHAIDREFRVITALAQSDIPVPATMFYCADVDVIGAEFYVMEYVEGHILEDFTIPGGTPSERAAIYESMNDVIARLHAIDPDDIGLSDFGKPGSYYERQIDLWMYQYQQQDHVAARFEDLATWLRANLIGNEQRRLVHGDFRLANLVIAPGTAEVAAVLDWELSTLGHPLADFAYTLSQWYLPNVNEAFGKVTLVDADLDSLGIPSMESFAAAYTERSGADISQHDLQYAIVFNLYRLAGIVIGVMGRTRAGTAKNDFARSAAHNLEPLLRLAWEYVELAEAD